MRNAIIIVLTILIIIFLIGYFGRKSIVVNNHEFDMVSNSIFSTPVFKRVGGSSITGGDYFEYMAIYEIVNLQVPLTFDFKPFDDLLKSKNKFSGLGVGGSQGLYWRQNWINNSRSIIITAVSMKNGNILVTYSEILK